MPTIIEVITQEESEHKLLPYANLTMALQLWAPKKKSLQMTLWEKKQVPESDFIQVPSHNHGTSKVQGYKYYTTPAKCHGNKKKDKTIKSKKKTGQAKNAGLLKAPNDCKEDGQLAHTLHMQKMKDLFNSFKK